jgi:hypothetical protein
MECVSHGGSLLYPPTEEYLRAVDLQGVKELIYSRFENAAEGVDQRG